MNRLIALLWGFAILLPSFAVANEGAKVDWSAWDMLPVHNDGRVMPLDTFARENISKISGAENPRIDLQAQLTEAEYQSASLAEARKMFPDGKPRRFRASEMLLSWMLEPEKWEYVPFIEAKHHELRTFLDLPMKNAEGDKIGFVSPHQLRDNDTFMQRISELVEKEREARASGNEMRLSDVDQKVRHLGQALIRWQSLVFTKRDSLTSNRRFADSILNAVQGWRGVSRELAMFREAGSEKTGLKEPIDRAQTAVDSLAEVLQNPNVDADGVEPLVRSFAEATEELSGQFAGLMQRMRQHPPAEGDPQRLIQLLGQMGGQVDEVARAARDAQQALYESDKAVRVVPALNAAALERDRDPENEAHPWIDLFTLVHGSRSALRGYPAADVNAVRESFNKVANIYPTRDSRPNDFSAALGELSSSLRALGENVEPVRAQLPIKNRDDDLIAYTMYPADNATSMEVRYNRIQPFQWAWVVNLLATFAFGLYVIGMRRSIIFHVGMLLLALGLVVAACGFAMRVAITGWAPVTNMYETVIFVPFFVAILGAWFALLPVTWDGLQAAWRLTAAPGTWEATPLDERQRKLMPEARWTALSVLLLIPRVALSALVLWILSIAPYSAGERTIINLLPNVEAGQSLPNFNNLLTWSVGLLVLAPSVWYLPRLVLAGAVAPIMIPLMVRGRREALFAQTYARWPFCLAATFIAFFGSALASFAPVLDGRFSPLQPVLRDNFWLLIHVLTIVASYGAGALAWGLANLALAYYLFGKYRQQAVPAVAGQRAAEVVDEPQAFVAKRPPEEAGVLSGYVYKSMQVAVVLLAAGTILGALWADVAWGRFWGWDPKEVWALISLLVYLAILHGRYAGMFGNFGLCVGAVLGFSAIVMSWYGVNFVLGVGLHSYGFGQGGQWWVFGAVGLNWLFMFAASARYLSQTQGASAFSRSASEEDDDSISAEPVV